MNRTRPQAHRRATRGLTGSSSRMLATVGSLLPGAALLTERRFAELTGSVFRAADADQDGLVSKADVYNLLVNQQVGAPPPRWNSFPTGERPGDATEV